MRATLAGCLAAGLALAASGCSEYLERRDTLLLGTGDAVQTNIATHVIDPWPAASRRLREPSDGDRIQRAVERYRTSSGGTASASGQAATLSPPSAPAPAASAGNILR